MSDDWEIAVTSILNGLADRLANMSYEQLKEQLPVLRRILTLDAKMAQLLLEWLDGVEQAFAISDTAFREALKRNGVRRKAAG